LKDKEELIQQAAELLSSKAVLQCRIESQKSTKTIRFVRLTIPERDRLYQLQLRWLIIACE